MENLEKLVNDPEAMEIIASKESSMWAFMYNTDAFAALINSETAMEKVAASETAVNVIIQGMTDTVNTSSALQVAKDDLESLQSSVLLLNNKIAIDKISKCISIVNDTAQTLDKVVLNADVVINNINTMMDSPVAMDTLLSNQSVVNSIFDNPKSRAAIAGKIQSGGKALIVSLYNSSLVISYMQTHASAIYSDASIYESTRSATIPGVAYITNYNGSFYSVIELFQTRNYYTKDGTYRNGTERTKNIGVFGNNYFCSAYCSDRHTDYRGFYVYGFKF